MRMQRRTKTIDSGIPGVSPTDQELVYAARREQDVAVDRGNFEWAAAMRDRQRALLGDNHPQVPGIGPGLNLQALIDALRVLEERAGALRSEVERVAAMSAAAAQVARDGISVPT